MNKTNLAYDNLLISDAVSCCKDMISIQERSSTIERIVFKNSDLVKINNTMPLRYKNHG